MMRQGFFFWALLLAIFCSTFGKGIGTIEVDSLEGIKMTDGKQRWPELTGKTGEEAKATIESEAEGVTANIIPQDAMVTMDYRTDRVWVRVDDNSKVVGIPQIG